MSLRVLTAANVKQITSNFSPEYLQSLMADVFALISSEAQEPPKAHTPNRIAIPMENHKALFMPARISATGTTMKVVSVPSRADDKNGLSGSTLVLDKVTGGVKAIVNARSLTALRNAAGSLLSTTLVGPTSPTHIVAFGAGQQILAHLDLHLRVFPSISSCLIVNRTLNERVSSVVSELRAKHPSVTLDSVASTDDSRDALRESLSKASIIITATPSRAPLFPSSWVRSGAHVILIGSYTPQMREVDRDLIMRAVSTGASTNSRVCSPVLLVDSTEACFLEAGEILEAGLKEDQVTEIGKLVIENRIRSEGQSYKSQANSEQLGDYDGPVTMFKSVGVGLQDVAIACAVVDKAEEMDGSGAKVGVMVEDYD